MSRMPFEILAGAGLTLRRWNEATVYKLLSAIKASQPPGLSATLLCLVHLLRPSPDLLLKPVAVSVRCFLVSFPLRSGGATQLAETRAILANGECPRSISR